jgi:hypothetical protein
MAQVGLKVRHLVVGSLGILWDFLLSHLPLNA